jgi:cytochrome c oxidase subunit 1
MMAEARPDVRCGPAADPGRDERRGEQAMGTQTVPPAAHPLLAKRHGRVIVDWLTTTDHKKIGHLYLITSFVFFLVGGVMALLMRAELARPGLQIVTNNEFNQLFTMHGTIMLLLFATPSFAGFAT